MRKPYAQCACRAWARRAKCVCTCMCVQCTVSSWCSNVLGVGVASFVRVYVFSLGEAVWLE